MVTTLMNAKTVAERGQWLETLSETTLEYMNTPKKSMRLIADLQGSADLLGGCTDVGSLAEQRTRALNKIAVLTEIHKLLKRSVADYAQRLAARPKVTSGAQCKLRELLSDSQSCVFEYVQVEPGSVAIACGSWFAC
eukprot:15105561-Alexandrium_andersonii.AAC.1